jgi:hypothetical protein
MNLDSIRDFSPDLGVCCRLIMADISVRLGWSPGLSNRINAE